MRLNLLIAGKGASKRLSEEYLKENLEIEIPQEVFSENEDSFEYDDRFPLSYAF